MESSYFSVFLHLYTGVQALWLNCSSLNISLPLYSSKRPKPQCQLHNSYSFIKAQLKCHQTVTSLHNFLHGRIKNSIISNNDSICFHYSTITIKSYHLFMYLFTPWECQLFENKDCVSLMFVFLKPSTVLERQKILKYFSSGWLRRLHNR